MQLVEVIAGRGSAPESVQRALRFVQKIGKLPVLVQDSPGFLVNRILLPYLTAAARFFEQGAGIEEIDDTMINFGMPMGPLRLIDEVGVDIVADVAATLSAAFPERMSVPEILPRMIAEGLLGRKAGQGFLIHHSGGKTSPNRELSASLPRGQKAGLNPEILQRLMVLPMIDEAARCLEEGIAETPRDIDFAMVMGTGWAPFRGGPLRYADSLGAEAVVEGLVKTEPCALLVEMARSGKRFHED